jgi:hypothetical protein
METCDWPPLRSSCLAANSLALTLRLSTGLSPYTKILEVFGIPCRNQTKHRDGVESNASGSAENWNYFHHIPYHPQSSSATI